MSRCMHPRIEACEQHEDDMHCAGWVCADCGQQSVGDCHPLIWCRPDFCGDEPVRDGAPVHGAVAG